MKTIKLKHILSFILMMIFFNNYTYSTEYCISLKNNDDTANYNDETATQTPTPIGLNTVNFYFENSASMNGYLKGDNFLRTMHRVIGRLQGDSFNSYFVNTQEYPAKDLLQKIDNGDISQGNTSLSDHKYIFTNAIGNAVDGNLSIVVTDGIYSVNGQSPAIVAEDIQIAFEYALNNNKIETVIIKLTSKFDGYYYSESCPPGKKAKIIKQNRPYYILLFGSYNAINDALKKIKIDELPGFNDKARFFITERIKTNYTVLTNGEKLHGKVIPENKFSKDEVHAIGAERYEVPGLFSTTPKDQYYLQFGIAVNYNNLELPESYLTDVKNYKVNSELDYTVTSVYKKPLERYGKNYTHVIVLKGGVKIYGQLSFSLKNNMPGWIKETGIKNDCEIEGNESQTYAFDVLIKGISEAYKTVNKSDIYSIFNVQIKPL